MSQQLFYLAANVLERFSTAYNDALGDICYDIKEREGGWTENTKAWGKACEDLSKILPQLREALAKRNRNLGMDSSGCEVFFEANGTTLVFDSKGKQIGQAQGGWVTVFAEFLMVMGLEPTKMTFTLPNGRRAKIIINDDGRFGWEVSDE